MLKNNVPKPQSFLNLPLQTSWVHLHAQAVIFGAPFGNAIKPERADITIPGHAPKPGAQTLKILSKIGLTETEIGSMIDEGSASEGWSDKYLPE